eukprot:scaffold257388_cov18-Tisochrysis_lutea.AAC.1
MNWDYEGMVKSLNNGQGHLWTAKRWAGVVYMWPQQVVGQGKCFESGHGCRTIAKSLVRTEEQLEDAISKATNEHKNKLCFIERQGYSSQIEWQAS